MSQHDTLTRALQEIADWNSHTTEFAVDYGSNGVRDFYRGIARAALSATQPTQVAQSTHWTEREPVRLAPSRVGRVYVAGPMTGIADFNFPEFNAEAEALRAQGLSVLNPADHGIVVGANWADYLRHDIAGLASCERIHLLRGWSKSKGAQLEVTIAKALGMVITYQDGAEPAQAVQSEPVKPLFAAKIAARKWAELQEQGARMQSIAFDGGKGGAGTIDPWGVVRWSQQAAQGEPLCDDEGCDHHGTPHVCVNNKQPAQGAGEVVAWCTPDGERCVTARTYEGARKDGGAMWSSMVPFTVPAYTQPATGAVVPDMVEIMALADSYRNATCHEATASAREWLRAAIAASGRQE